MSACSTGELGFVDVTDATGRVAEPQWLARAESVHRQLREHLPADYAPRMAQIFAAGARMTLAVAGGEVLAVSVWRLIENTHEGRKLYVDDLVTNAADRSHGVGRALLARLESRARDAGCSTIALDSGTQRTDAHRFYFRAGYVIPAFSFRKTIQ